MGPEPDIVSFYNGVMSQVLSIVDETRARANRNDVVQFGITGENIWNERSVVINVDETGENICPALESLLNRVVQSNCLKREREF